jgi:hypothetical protein
MSRRISVFFYGLFMDAELLRGKGVRPEHIRRASVGDFQLRIGQRATLIPMPGQRSWGVVMQLMHREIDQLYSDSTLAMYRPEAVLADVDDEAVVAALCFNLIEAPRPDERNAEYAIKLRGLAERLKLPPEYVEAIQ